jgi:drug/metabolite transporter (DMT)-like permease
MVGGGLSSEGYVGIALVFAMAISYAAFTVTLRRGSGGDLLPAAFLAGTFVALAAGTGLAGTESFGLTSHDLLLCLALGVFQTGLGTMLMVHGSKHVPASQIGLLAMLEVVLSPVWVWLAVGEEPAAAIMLRGGVIAAAIGYQALGGMQRREA